MIGICMHLIAFAYMEAKYRALRGPSRKLSFSRIRFYNLFCKRRPTNVNCSKVWTFNFKNVVDESWDLMASMFGSEGCIISSAGTAKCVALVLSFCQQHGGTLAEDVASAAHAQNSA